MPEMRSGRVALIVNPTRSGARVLAERSLRWWSDRGFEVVVDDGAPLDDRAQLDDGAPVARGDFDFAVSLGGDGTMLRTVQLVLDRQVPVLGVNFGNLGYLTQVEPSGVEDAFEKLVCGEFSVEERMTLEIAVGGSVAPKQRFVALNEIALEKAAPGHTIRVSVSIAGRHFLTYAADGIIVATPTGSTAYNLSARGPIVSPRLRALVLTPISPHMLFDRSLVLEPDEAVGLRLLDGRPAVLTVDGSTLVPLQLDEIVEVATGPCAARIIRFAAPDFHAILRAKFGLADR